MTTASKYHFKLPSKGALEKSLEDDVQSKEASLDTGSGNWVAEVAQWLTPKSS